MLGWDDVLDVLLPELGLEFELLLELPELGLLLEPEEELALLLIGLELELPPLEVGFVSEKVVSFESLAELVLLSDTLSVSDEELSEAVLSVLSSALSLSISEEEAELEELSSLTREEVFELLLFVFLSSVLLLQETSEAMSRQITSKIAIIKAIIFFFVL